jgi:hypothetical protein
MKKLIIIIPIVLVFLICVFVIDWHFPKVTSQHHEPNKYDSFYIYAALASNRPEFCERISPFSYTVASWGGDGTKVQLEQSRCFSDLAMNTLNPSYCEKVKPINTWLLNGSESNPYACRAEISRVRTSPGRSNVGTALDENQKKEFLQEMGLNYASDLGYQEDVAKYMASQGSSSRIAAEDNAFRNYWFRILKTDEFMAKAMQFPRNN